MVTEQRLTTRECEILADVIRDVEDRVQRLREIEAQIRAPERQPPRPRRWRLLSRD